MYRLRQLLQLHTLCILLKDNNIASNTGLLKIRGQIGNNTSLKMGKLLNLIVLYMAALLCIIMFVNHFLVYLVRQLLLHHRVCLPLPGVPPKTVTTAAYSVYTTIGIITLPSVQGCYKIRGQIGNNNVLKNGNVI